MFFLLCVDSNGLQLSIPFDIWINIPFPVTTGRRSRRRSSRFPSAEDGLALTVDTTMSIPRLARSLKP